MTEENEITVRVPLDKVFIDNGKQVAWVNLGEAQSVLKMVLMGMSNPGQAVVRREPDEDRQRNQM